MAEFRWNELKSARLKRTRGVSFEEAAEWRVIDIVEHPTRPEQRIVLFERNRYIWVSPCIQDGDVIFLKTLYPSRKYTRLYRQGALR
jgi:uncharacterized DUF497 family protein